MVKGVFSLRVSSKVHVICLWCHGCHNGYIKGTDWGPSLCAKSGYR